MLKRMQTQTYQQFQSLFYKIITQNLNYNLELETTHYNK